MKTFYLPFGLTVVGNLFYHLSQKSIPKAANPFHTYIIIYFLALVLCAVGAFFYPGSKTLWQTAKEANWAMISAALAVVTIEIGFLLVYRVGWNISVASVACSVAVTIVLLPLGLLLFGEKLSLRNLLGLLFCVIGLILVARE